MWPHTSFCARMVQNLLIYIYLHCVRRLSWSATYMATLLYIYISYMFLLIIHTLCEVIVKFIQELHYFRIISASPEKLILCQNTVIVSVNFAEEFFCFYLRVFLAQWNNFRWNSLIVEFYYRLSSLNKTLEKCTSQIKKLSFQLIEQV